MNKFAVIVDLNGTLVDTEYAFFQAYKDALTKFNVSFTIEDFTQNWSTEGKKLKDYLEKIKRQDLFVKEKEILIEKDMIFQETLESRAILMPGAQDLLFYLQKENISLGLDSSTSRMNIDKLLKLFNIESTFAVIASGDMEIDEAKYGDIKKKSSRLKVVADILQFPYKKCIVIGDAEKDIKGANEAGMKSIAIPNQYTKSNDFSLADKKVTSLKEITIDLLNIVIK